MDHVFVRGEVGADVIGTCMEGLKEDKALCSPHAQLSEELVKELRKEFLSLQ